MEYLQLQSLLKKFSKEDIIASAYSSPRKPNILIRIHNSKPDKAVIKGLHNGAVNITKEYVNVTKAIVEYIPGTSRKTSSRKIDMDTYIATIEDLIQALNNPDYIVKPNIVSYDYEPKIMTKEGLVTKSSL